MANQFNKSKADFLSQCIADWQQDGLIDAPTAQKLKDSYTTKSFDWKSLAQYAFWLAVLCGFVALASLFISTQFLRFISKLYYTPNIIIAIISAAAAAFFYYAGFKRRRKKSTHIISTEAYVLSAIVLTANAVAYMGKALQLPTGAYGMLVLAAIAIYAAVALTFRSLTTWVFALISLYIWFGTQSTLLGTNNYTFWGMNYPLRFLAFSAIILGVSQLLKRSSRYAYLFQVTYIIALSAFFASLFLVSIFGNISQLDTWYAMRQTQLIPWAIGATLLCGGLLLLALKKQYSTLRDFAITFLILNIYSRYFELLYNSLNKALFFGILAISFWFVGRKAEKIWHRKSG